MSFIDMLKFGALNFKDRTFILLDNLKITYERANDVVTCIGNLFSKFKSEFIAVRSENSLGEILGFLGVLFSKNVPIIVNKNIDDLSFLGKVENLEDFYFEEGILIEFYRINIIHENKNIRAFKEKVIFKRESLESFGVLSSGTTGTPKLIVRSSESWIRAFSYQSYLFNLRRVVKSFLVGSFSFSANLNMAMHILNLGGSIITTDSHLPKTWREVIKFNKVNSIFLVPSRYRILLKCYEEENIFIESVLSCGEKLSYNLFDKLNKIFRAAKVIEYYGSSETSFISYNSQETFSLENKGVGIIFPEVQIIVNSNEFLVSSPYAAYGFEKRFKVNDYGFIDSNGILIIEGRGNDVVNKAGNKISLKRIRSIIEKNELIEEFVALKLTSKLSGEEVGVVIVLKNKNTSINILKASLKNELSLYEMPRVVVVEKLPINNNGKIDIKRLINLF
ncbi:AMP-binding protein [Clostridium perfringens]|nr:AMP-binding protein [Clostridium perfringens]